MAQIHPMRIGGLELGPHSKTFIVAEMSANHGGSLERALEIVRAAKRCGADAIKLQTYRADTITLDCDGEDFLIPKGNPWEKDRTLYHLYEKAYTPWEWHESLFQEARRLGLICFSAPFDLTAVDFLETFDPPAYKIASPEITDIPLIEKVAATGKPVIVSTGLGALEDVELAVKTIRAAGPSPIVLLKCTSAYPAPPEDAHLATIPDMAKRFDCVTGLSDHTLGIGVPIAAVALGAKMIEKHIILDKSHESVDSFFSLDEKEFGEMVRQIRVVEQAIGVPDYSISKQSQKNMLARRSLYVAETIPAGALITDKNVKSVRPSYGMHPKHYREILGRKTKVTLKKGDRLTWDALE